ncbi:MAG TPA: CHASE2 domain-containing protein [Terriglobia bacterium]|nr:CHASE2 domain-containing protein [Terriglobia bacterium]
MGISGLVCVLSVAMYAPASLVRNPRSLARLLNEIELKTLDLRFLMRGFRTPNPAIAIVAVDQKTLDVLGHWPITRDFYANTVDILREDGARVIAFNIVFPEPDRNSAMQPVQRDDKTQDEVARSAVKSPAPAARLKAPEARTDNDQKFADAILWSHNTILAYSLLFDLKDTKTQNKQRVREFVSYLTFAAGLQVIHPEYGKSMNCQYCEAVGVIPDLPKLAENAKNFGFFIIVPDQDGVVRSEPLVIRFQNNYYLSLDVAAVVAYNNLSPHKVAAFLNSNGLEGIELASRAIRTDPDGYVQINYRGPAGTYPTYSFGDVIQGKIPASAFKDKIVLIGVTANGIVETSGVPFQTSGFPGVEVHANIMDNLLSGQFIHRGPRENLADIGLIILFSLAPGLLLGCISPMRATVLVAIISLAFLWLAYYLFASHHVWLSVLFPITALASSYGGIVAYYFLIGRISPDPREANGRN